MFDVIYLSKYKSSWDSETDNEIMVVCASDRQADRQTGGQTGGQTGCCSGNLSPTSSSRAAGCRSTSLRSVQLSPPASVHQADARRRVSPLHLLLLLLLHRPDWRAGERRDSQAEKSRADPLLQRLRRDGPDRGEPGADVLCCCCCCFVAWRTERFLWRCELRGGGTSLVLLGGDPDAKLSLLHAPTRPNHRNKGR